MEKTKELCPYCHRKKRLKQTCGDPQCQHEHHKKSMIVYWRTFYAKLTIRKRS